MIRAKNVIIISGNSKKGDFTLDLLKELVYNGIYPKKVIGCYKGEEELSFVCITEELELLHELANKYFQESILVSNSRRESHLLFRDGSELYLGKLKSVSEEVAKSNDGYTYCPRNNSYYICEK